MDILVIIKAKLKKKKKSLSSEILYVRKKDQLCLRNEEKFAKCHKERKSDISRLGSLRKSFYCSHPLSNCQSKCQSLTSTEYTKL